MLIFLHSSNLLIIKNNLNFFNRTQLETSTFPFAYWIFIENKPKKSALQSNNLRQKSKFHYD